MASEFGGKNCTAPKPVLLFVAFAVQLKFALTQSTCLNELFCSPLRMKPPVSILA